MPFPAALAFLANPAFWAGAGKVASVASAGASIFKGFGASGDDSSPAGGVNIGGGPSFSEDPYFLKSQQLLFPAGKSFLEGDIGFDLPSYATSPYYTRGQEALAPLGEQILSGKPPEWLRPIGQPGGAEFEDVLKLTTRDITKAVREDVAKRGLRGGIGTSAIAKSVADVTSRLRFDDLIRSIEGKKTLLGAGIDIAGGTRAAGLSEAQMKNLFGLDLAKTKIGIKELGLATLGDVRGSALDMSKTKSAFDLEVADLQLRQEALQNKIATAESERSGSMWQQILSSSIQAIPKIGELFKKRGTVEPTPAS